MREALCFFEHGGTQINDACRQAVSHAADTWRRFYRLHQQKQVSGDDGRAKPPVSTWTVRVQVQGYAPDADNPRASERLSLLRALAVADELGRSGVPDGCITLIGVGHGTAPTPTEALDPHDRRVSIDPTIVTPGAACAGLR